MSVSWTLLRHGETEGPQGFRGRLDPPLSAEGLAAMRAAVGGRNEWDFVVTSPMQRCVAFAREWAARHDRAMQIDHDIRELDFGDWEGRTAAELMVDQATALGCFWQDPYSYTPPNGEPVAAFEKRVVATIARLTRAHAGKRILLVTHGGVIRLLIARAKGMQRRDLLQVQAGYAQWHGVISEWQGGVLHLRAQD
jgi:alpha-ribazole phosphatase